jgi:WD40 repeat protein
VAFSPDGALLATASADGTARTWDTATGQPRTTLTGHHGPVRGVAFSPDGTLLATASFDGTARIWDAATGAHLVTLLTLPDGGSAVLLPDGSYKLSGDPRGALWWAIKLCRFEPGELDPYVEAIRRLPADATILPRRRVERETGHAAARGR